MGSSAVTLISKLRRRVVSDLDYLQATSDTFCSALREEGSRGEGGLH